MDGLILAMLLAAPVADPAAAPTVGEADSRQAAQQIVVTGERVARTLRQTASSVAVVSQEEIEAANAGRIDEVLAMIPNVQMASGEHGPTIRGQDSTGVLRSLFAFLGGTRARAALQIDGRAANYYEYISSSIGIWDAEKIEVFRSPQTTTQGRNAIAGAIFVETNDPTYDWQGRARAAIAEGGSRQASAVVSGPIVDGQLALRLAGDIRRGRMASTLFDAIPDADIQRDDYGLARAKLLFEPAALPGLRLETTYVHNESQSPQFEAVRAPFELRRTTGPEITNGIHRIRSDALTTRLRYDLSSTATAAVSYSYGEAKVQRFGVPGFGRTRVDSQDKTIEAVLQWRPDPGLSLVSGINRATEKKRQTIDITGLGIGRGGFDDRQRSVGLFGEATVRPVPSLALTAGLRYQRDKQVRYGRVGTPPSGISLAYDREFRAWLPKFSIAYDLSGTTTVGVLAQRATNPGGTSINLRRRVQDDFEAEMLWNYEAFLRSSFDGGRGRISANVFYNDVTNAQREQLVSVPLPGGGSFDNVEFANAPKARTYGAEISLAWKPVSTLSAQIGAGLLRTRIVETLRPADPTRGKVFQRAPRLSLNGAIDWKIAVPLTLSAQASHHSGYFSDDANTPALRIPATTVVNVKASYAIGQVQLFAYARNVFDAFYLTHLYSPTFAAAGDPREVGGGVEVRF